MSDTRVRTEAATFIRFCVVGGGGFLVDAGVLAIFTHFWRVDPVVARFVSAPLAIVATFVLNRTWAFAFAGEKSLRTAFLAYCAVQGLGFGVNFLVFSVLVWLPLGAVSEPVAALTVASGVALAFNFFGIRFFAFAPGPGARDRASR